MSLADDFHQVALQVYEDGKMATGYRGTRYLQNVRNDGGGAAAKSWLKPKKKNDAPTGGFLKLVDFGRLDLSLEAHVVEDRWSSIFTAEEIAVARARLARYGYFDNKRRSPRGPAELPEEVGTHTEGKTRQITVNVYERDPKARAACIRKYGAECYVCQLSFSDMYGPETQGFIHVHHLCPLASVGHEYSVDPISDLRPVCPNCHAVIHMTDPPRTIEEVRAIIANNK